MNIQRWARASALAALLASSGGAQAVFIGNSQGGAEFPQGAASFADAVVSLVVGAGNPSAAHVVPASALGLPDYANDSNCNNNPSCTFVSLGSGGVLVLQFIDNRLTGSGNADLDLWVFEVGPAIEDTFVDISADGVIWHAVGKVAGSTAGIDIDAFGFGLAHQFAFVRLTDDVNEGTSSGNTAGADIDAVGAISTVRVSIPEPGTWSLLALVAIGSGLGPALRRGSARWKRPRRTGTATAGA